MPTSSWWRAGIAGVATAWALAGYKGSVVLLEQFELGHERGSSHGTSRIFRLNYPDERFVRLAMAADEAWRKLEAERGEHLIERVGSLDLGPVAAETGRALASCGVPYETLSAQEIGALAAATRARRDRGVPARRRRDVRRPAHATLVAEAVQGGVEVREETPVRSLALERNAVRLALDSGELTARAVVVAAGAWGPALLAPSGSSFPSCRRERPLSTSRCPAPRHFRR